MLGSSRYFLQLVTLAITIRANKPVLYFFKLNDQRDGLEIQDAIIDSEEELNSYILGTGFGSITDIQSGPDGDIYIVSLESGNIYKIS